VSAADVPWRQLIVVKPVYTIFKIAVVFLSCVPKCLCNHQNLLLIGNCAKAACNERYKQMMSMARQSEAMLWSDWVCSKGRA